MMWNPLPATYLQDVTHHLSTTSTTNNSIQEAMHILDLIFFRKKTSIPKRVDQEGRQVDLATDLAPMAKATRAEWLRVKKYFPPGWSPVHSSRSDSCSNPAAFSCRFASSLAHRKATARNRLSSVHVHYRRTKGGNGTGRVPTAWKAVGEALRKSMRSQATSTAAMGGGFRQTGVGTERENRHGSSCVCLVLRYRFLFSETTSQALYLSKHAIES
jgi:hypothetical protein